MAHPEQVMNELTNMRKSLVSAVQLLQDEGFKYAQVRRDYKRESAILKLTLCKDNSATKAEMMAEGHMAGLLGEYEYLKVIYDTMKDVVKTKSALCNVLQTEFNGLCREWNETV